MTVKTLRLRWCTTLCGAWVVTPGLAAWDAPGQDCAGSNLRIEHEVTVGAPTQDVWRAWTTVDGVTSFGPPQARVELAVGGAYEWYFAPDAPPGQRGSEGCTVLSYVPGEMLAFSWNAPPSIPGIRDSGQRTQVVVRLEPDSPGRTRVRLTQHGFGSGEDWDRYYAYFDRAWASVLDALRSRMEARWSTDAGAIESRTSQAPSTVAPNAGANGNSQVEPTAPASHWVCFVHPSRPEILTTPTEDELKLLGRHVEYIRALTQAGTILLAGPCVEPAWYPRSPKGVRLELPAPGIVVFEAPSAEAAQAIMDGDPAVAGGVFQARMHGIKLAFQRQEKTQK